MKNKFLNSFIIITLILVAFIVYNKFKLSQNSHFAVTADTVIKPGSEISKYVTQEEVDSFSFRYWDIDTYEVKNNSTMENFRQILKSKNTKNILNFMKDNNMSVDIPLHYGVTPLMYASFYDDEKTMKEFIKIGADINATDKYKLSPMAYAIENNSTKAVKTLLDNGVVFKDMWIQIYRQAPLYRAGIDKIVIDGNNMEIYYAGKSQNKEKYGFSDGISAFGYAITRNYIEIVQYILESGYKHPKEIGQYPESNTSSYDSQSSIIGDLENIPNYEDMLNLLLDYNISGQPSKEFLKSEYEKCYKEKKSDELFYEYYEINKKKFDEDNIKVGKTPEKENQFFPLQKYMWLKHYYTYCKDKNSTFNDTKEYIDWKNANNLLKAVSPKLENNNPKIIFKNTSQDEVMNCYRKLVEPSSSKINLNDNCLNLKF